LRLVVDGRLHGHDEKLGVLVGCAAPFAAAYSLS
jgi:hypothetical protein